MLSPQLDPHPTHNDPQTQIDRLTNSIDALRPSSTSNQPMARSSSNLEGVHQPFQSHQDQNLDRLDPSDPIPDSHGNADDDDRRHHYYDPPIRLLFLDFEVQEELRFGLSQICDQSVRSNMNMIKLIDHLSPTPAPSADPSNRPLPALESIDPSTLRYFNQLINSSRSSIDPRSPNPNRSSVHSSSAQNHPSYPNLDENLTGPHDLQPEFWWFIQFSRDDQLTQNAFTIRTSHENFVDLSNTSTTYLIEVVESIASSVPSRDPNNSSLSSSSSTNHGLERFLINITYKRKFTFDPSFFQLKPPTSLPPFSSQLRLIHIPDFKWIWVESSLLPANCLDHQRSIWIVQLWKFRDYDWLLPEWGSQGRPG